MTTRYTFAVCALLWASLLSAQNSKTLEAVFQDAVPLLDGRLTDSCWQHLSPAGIFVTAAPVFGEMPRSHTEIRLFYGADALYIAAYCHAPETGSIRYDAGIRDGLATGDWFQVSLDTWNDDRLAFDFTVTAAGVQRDSRQGAGNWDVTWQSAVIRHADGWSVEIRIPFTALRFPRKAEQNWGLQCTRFDRATGETSTWNPQNPQVTDRTLQFGTLAGLRDIRQERRMSLALNSEAGLNTSNQPYDIDSYFLGFGLDGRVGLSESVTLDFTILPQQAYSSASSLIIGPTRSDWTDGIPPVPRQFIEEERDLFTKSANMDDFPAVYAGDLAWRLPNDSNFSSLFTFTQSRLLQATKLTARTKGNWRFGISNALLGPVQGHLQNRQTLDIETRTLQPVSNYNFMSVERVLPNNSYVHFSNATLLAGHGHTSAQPGLSLQLRDRTNTYEVRAGSTWQYHLRDQDEAFGYQYNLSLARINRRWGWSVSHYESYRPIKLLPGAFQVPRYAQTIAAVQYREFSPRGAFLNLLGSAGVDIVTSNNPAQPVPWYLYGYLSGLDKKFRIWTVSLRTQPYNQKRRYTSGGSYINQQLAPSIGGSLGFRSDTRKRLILEGYAAGSSSIKGEFPNLSASASASWVISPKLVFQGDFASGRQFQTLELLPASDGRWLFERSDRWQYSGSLTLNWYPRARWLLWAGYMAVRNGVAKQEVVELQENGALVPVEWVLTTLDAANTTAIQFGFQHYFSSISQLRFQYGYNQGSVFRFIPTGPFFDTGDIGEARLTLICFLDGNRR